jgi:glutamyl-tRNA(Gln) amidotransferase subunit E
MNPKENYESTKKSIGYVERKQATQKDYDRIGFMSGLEVHQQLLTEKKLFCRCPAGVYQDHDDYDAEIIRHMRPTLSELGEYDGTALMEFKTRKNIVYRLKNVTACTYDIDDTPPFPINREALEKAIVISHLCKLNIVGELHITRKQYLDGSIPTGFQRTAIVGVEGVIHLKNKDVRLIQLSIEEDSCREVSDIGHERIYKTDRLGMPLIETVTYPDMVNPEEVKEACDYIRFLNRSTGMVRTGMGAGRQDVNVSCRGGTRVEIKGVAHTKWIPELTHNECYRQWALLQIKEFLHGRIQDITQWKMKSQKCSFTDFSNSEINKFQDLNYDVYAVCLPGFGGVLSHFTQPGQCFANEISDRLKVIACIEKPNMTTSESLEMLMSEDEIIKLKNGFQAEENDAILVFWGNTEDVKTALETIEERCVMSFHGVPNETRKSFEDGTTIFERVLPGADRMYPDTDSPPIPLADDYISKLSENLPQDIIERYRQLRNWGVAENYDTFIFKRNLYPLFERIVKELQVEPQWLGRFFGQDVKNIEGTITQGQGFTYELIYDLFAFVKQQKIEKELAINMLKVLYHYPKMDFESVLETIKFKRLSEEDIVSKIPFLKDKFEKTARKSTPENMLKWVMGHLIPIATGNMCLKKLSEIIKNN